MMDRLKSPEKKFQKILAGVNICIIGFFAMVTIRFIKSKYFPALD
jgi:hypothetical protein